MMKIAVFMGGSSPEREVSLNSGREIVKGLREKGVSVFPFDVEWEGKRTLLTAIEDVLQNNIDVIFLALHGGLGELFS